MTFYLVVSPIPSSQSIYTVSNSITYMCSMIMFPYSLEIWWLNSNKQTIFSELWWLNSNFYEKSNLFWFFFVFFPVPIDPPCGCPPGPAWPHRFFCCQPLESSSVRAASVFFLGGLHPMVAVDPWWIEWNLLWEVMGKCEGCWIMGFNLRCSIIQQPSHFPITSHNLPIFPFLAWGFTKGKWEGYGAYCGLLPCTTAKK